MLSSTPIFRIEADVGEIQRFGHTPYGERRVIDITGGRVHGARLTGTILPRRHRPPDHSHRRGDRPRRALLD